MKRVNNNRQFRQTIKPNFTDKTLKGERITLVDGDKVITVEKDVVKKFKDHFEKIVETLKIDHPILSNLSDDPVPTKLAFLKSKKGETLLIAFLLN